MNPPTVFSNLPAWLNDVAVPFARKALVGAGQNGWISVTAQCSAAAQTGQIAVYPEHGEIWYVEKGPYNAHEQLTILADKQAFLEGWQALVSALYNRYTIVGAGMILDFKNGVPYIEVYATVPGYGSYKASVRVLEQATKTASLDVFVQAFSKLDSLPKKQECIT